MAKRFFSEGTLNVKVQHAGNDGGKIKDITLWSSQRSLGLSFKCDIGIKLDHDESTTATCIRSRSGPNPELNNMCNGDEKFCQIKFNQFMFAGTHNSGTGMGGAWILDCYVKNHDLTITEMLDFGIRMFDFDTYLK